MLYNALQKAKKTEDKKVAMNIQVPSLLKEKFDELCKEEGVSVTALICSLMESAIEEKSDSSFYQTSTMELITKLEDHLKERDEHNHLQNQGVQPHQVGLPFDDWDAYFENERLIINALKIELENRGKRLA